MHAHVILRVHSQYSVAPGTPPADHKPTYRLPTYFYMLLKLYAAHRFLYVLPTTYTYYLLLLVHKNLSTNTLLLHAYEAPYTCDFLLTACYVDTTYSCTILQVHRLRRSVARIYVHLGYGQLLALFSQLVRLLM